MPALGRLPRRPAPPPHRQALQAPAPGRVRDAEDLNEPPPGGRPWPPPPATGAVPGRTHRRPGPAGRERLWAHLGEIRERAATLFLTTHYLEEAERCDRVAIVDGGRIVARGTPAELKSALTADRIDLGTGDDVAAAWALRERFGIEAVAGPHGLRVQAEDGARLVPRLCAGLDVPVHEVAVTRPSLDDVFLHHTGRFSRLG